ncbi:hypothetical protein S40285_04354 [Stachybotrys chlorohalonatus IBT 40285]|uniref:Tat pathway signal sequence n=1 Tax=Stachybotrys chlorohalonatus (strain IBT 40285) TaxID=1283841 RepID=A0A084QNQ9_STAC4|nr:hypothetical protein S40285_04354 [Stachybotrys chlorohalonata IBT 40285]
MEQQPRPSLSRSPGSRSSFMSVGRMPVIDEDEEIRTHPRATTPLQMPQRSYRRSTARGLPPPYVPASYLPPTYILSKEARRLGDNSLKGRLRRFWYGETPWFTGRRRTWKLIALFGLLITIVVALAVGLTVGLRNRGGGDGAGDNGTTFHFPVGSFALNTTLQRTTTDCTSNPATWRCYPYEDRAPATFFWVITENNSSSFNISSTENPFAPTFSNLTMEILDGNQLDERLVFSFSMAKTVVPSEGLSPGNNRAARCTFPDTMFEATLWTRRRNGQVLVPPIETNDNFEDWPGDVEVAQIKASALSSPPMCEDNQGTLIADVQAGPGECECRYASFDLD